MMATGKRGKARRGSGRHSKPPKYATDTYVQLLWIGMVTAGLGVAVSTGHGVAAAAPDEGSESSNDAGTSTPSSSTSSPSRAHRSSASRYPRGPICTKLSAS